MMLVHVYSETPMYGAMMRPAISSITSVQKLPMNTIVQATQGFEIRTIDGASPIAGPILGCRRRARQRAGSVATRSGPPVQSLTCGGAVVAGRTSSDPADAFASVDAVERALANHDYVAESGLAMAIFLALKLGKPLLLEGEAGVGKTEIAKVLASTLDAELIRLQCYEGIDVASAVYEWNYLRQILHLRAAEATGTAEGDAASQVRGLFGPEFLLKRPLLRALDASDRPAVLLIDEIDRSDDEFEAFLLELLSDFQITIPEIGTIRAERRPAVIITSNRTREIHDALKRRCIYFWIDYPSLTKERRIVRARVPEIEAGLGDEVCRFVQGLRKQDLYKLPGVAETLDWARALVTLGCRELDERTVVDTIGCLLKYQEDLKAIEGDPTRTLVSAARAV
jgi:MoxR-like ATPase